MTDSSDEEFYDNKEPPSRFDGYAEVDYDLNNPDDVNNVFYDFKHIFSKTVLDTANSAQTAIGMPNEEEITEIAESGIMKTVNRYRLDDMRNGSTRDFGENYEPLNEKM